MEPGASEPHRLFDDSFLRFLPKPVREPRRAWLVLPLCWILTLAGAALIASALALVLPEVAQPDFSFLVGKGWITVLVLAVVTPLFETLILALICSLLHRFIREEWAVLITALGWGLAHSYQAPLWGPVIFWPFIIFTSLYVVWKQRSIFAGIMMAWLAHLLHNLISAVAIGFPGVIPAV